MKKIYARSTHLWKLLTFPVCIAFLSLISFQASGQAITRTITGQVIDDLKVPVIGANVLVKGTTTGTVTDLDGRFSVEAADSDILLVSYTGYSSQEITVGTQTFLSITLAESATKLDEVVVIGYGSVRRSDLTGAVSSVSGDQLNNSVVASLDQALQGRIAGVQVTQNSGQPGGVASVRIRGASSITGSSEPLYVVDGIPFQGDGQEVAGFDWAGGANGQERVNVLSTISPSDIVSIEVLKDASATAIYGSRAANGVVIITTKRGRKGESKINYNGYYGSQEVGTTIPMMNLPQFADYQLQIAGDVNLPPNQRYLDPTLLGPGTDWQDEVFQRAGMHNHQLSVIGGTDRTTYAITGNYFDQDGIIIGSNFERISARLNLENQVKSWIKVGGNLAYANTDERITLNDGGDGVIMQALLMQPDVPVRDFNGNYAGPEVQAGASTFNPVASALLRNNTMERQRLYGNVYGVAELVKGLSLRSEVGFDNNHSLNIAFHPTYRWGVIINNENQLRLRDQNSIYWNWRNYLTYDKAFGDRHALTVLLGTEAEKSSWEGSQVTKKNFSSNDIHVLSEGDDETSSTFGWKDASSLASYYGRINYALSQKYLFTVTMRADGSSKFGPENKWGFFPSGALAWRISEENFLKGSDVFSNLKLRVGYGLVGNQAIGTYLYGSSLLTVNTPFGTAYRLEKISNPNLKWESTKQFNAGVDVSFLNNRVDLTFDFYNKQTYDMLLQLSIPSYLGGTNYNDIRAPYANVGKMENRGFEISVSSRNIQKPKFGWSTDLTFSRNKNKILELDEETRIYWRNLYWYSEFQTATQTEANYPLGLFYGYVTEGLFTDQQDILDHAVQFEDNNNEGKNLVDKFQGVWVGDVKFKDLNNDGVINSDDQTIIGDPNPDFTFGVNNTFSFGPLELLVYFTGSYGADILNYARVQIEGQTSVFNNQAATVADRARIGLHDPSGSALDPANVFLLNPGGSIPRPATNDVNRNNRMSDRFIEDGSYLRLQNVRIGYTLPARITQRAKVERLKLYVNGQNLHTFTNYSGYDPEIGAFNQDPLLQNVDMGRYPTPRVITFGIDLDF